MTGFHNPSMTYCRFIFLIPQKCMYLKDGEVQLVDVVVDYGNGDDDVVVQSHSESFERKYQNVNSESTDNIQ